jgi:uncharacterized BrkB/YihY/UPF0761 family membrane protein
VDHLCRAAERYDELDGSRLAAAITYYGFFAAFALGVLLFAVLGTVLAHEKSAEKQQRRTSRGTCRCATCTSWPTRAGASTRSR